MRILMNSVDILRGGISKVSREMILPDRWSRGLQFLTIMLFLCMTGLLMPQTLWATDVAMPSNGLGSIGTTFIWEAPAGTEAGDWTNWDDDDGDATISLTTDGAAGKDFATVTLTDPGLSAADEIYSITVNFTCLGIDSLNSLLWGLPGGDLAGGATAMTGGFVKYSDVFLNPGSWDNTTLGAVEAGISQEAYGNKDNQCTSVNTTVQIKEQTLDGFVDDSSSQYAPQLDLPIAKIMTNALGTGGGHMLTDTQVKVVGDLSSFSINVYWNTTDNPPPAATLVGQNLAPTLGTYENIALNMGGGAGDDSGYLYYTIDYPLGTTGTYFMSISTVVGNSGDNLPLPRETAPQAVKPPAQTLDYFTDYGKNFNANRDAPQTDLLLVKIKSFKTATGRDLSSTNVTVSGELSAMGDIKVWWNTADSFPAGATEVGNKASPSKNTAYEIPLSGAGYDNGYLFYTISFPDSGTTGDYSMVVNSITGISQDNLELPMSSSTCYVTDPYAIQVCGDCHAYPPIDGTRDSATGAVLGIHSTHSRFNPMLCVACHGDTTSGETKMAHRDGNIDIKAPMGSGGDYSKNPGPIAQTPTPTTGDCSNLQCHNSIEKPANDRTWPTVVPISCNDCHLSSVADVDDYEFRQFTTASVPRLLDSEWDTRGHGRTSGSYELSLNPAPTPNMDCPACHDPTVPHGDPVMPYKTNGTGDQDIFCLNCHGDAATRGTLFTEVVATTQDIRTHSQSVFEDVGYGNITTWRVATLKCIDCHDPHGDSNLEMIQKKVWTSGSDSKGRPIMPYYNGYSTVEFTAFVGAGGYGMGDNVTDTYVCEVCHTRTDFHTQGGNGTDHYNGIKCSDCHQHSKGWAPLEKCTECHAIPRNYFYNARQIVGPGGDFVRMSRHVSNGSTEEIVTSYDCIVCHMEGDYAKATAGTGYTDNLKHNESTDPNVVMVNLRNVDDLTDTTGYAWNKYATGAAKETMRTDMDLFCMGCHDNDGASKIAVNTNTDGLEYDEGAGVVARRLTPFNKLDNLRNMNDGFQTRIRVVDVSSQFDLTNPSHHAVKGARYGGKNADWNASNGAAWTTHTLRNNTQMSDGSGGGVGEQASLHCSDCHLSETNAHGAEAAWHMLLDGTVDNFTNDSTITGKNIEDFPTSVVCYKCHNENEYTNTAGTIGRWKHNDEGRVWASVTGDAGTWGSNLGVACLLCHSGDGFGHIHGRGSGTDGDAGTYSADGVNHTKYRFMPGGHFYWNPGTEGGDAVWGMATPTNPSCYFPEAGNQFSQCIKHAGGGLASPVNYGRAVSY